MVIGALGLVGVGLGRALSQQYTLVVQNAVVRVATWGGNGRRLQFFRNVGATVGTAIFGTVLTAGLDKAIFANLPPQAQA